MTKRECMAEWFCDHGICKEDIDAMGDVEMVDEFCYVQRDCGVCPFTNDCPPVDDDEICEWIHNGGVNEG